MVNKMYDKKSDKAVEFISNEEILRCLGESKKQKPLEFYMNIVEKAKKEKGLTHEEVAYLINCNKDEVWDEIFKLANKIKNDYYGNRIVLFAPLYLSNYCINGCTYCPYHAKNKTIPRKKTYTRRNKKRNNRTHGYGTQKTCA